MFRNYLAAALRNLVRNRLYAAINIVGLAVGFSVALLIAVYVFDEVSYDTWIPDHAQIYRLSGRFYAGNQLTDKVLGHLADWIKEDAPQVQAVARLASPSDGQGIAGAILSHNGVETREEQFYWGDPNFFDLIPLPAVAGDPKSTLERPDGLVLTRQAARRYFGRDTPLGETLLLDREYPMTVGAVIEDLPENTHLAVTAIGSGKAPFSRLAKIDADPNPRAGAAYTYVRLNSVESLPAFSRLLPTIIDNRQPLPPGGAPGKKPSDVYEIVSFPIAAIHLSPAGFAPMKPRGDQNTLVAMMLVGLLITAVASMNFISLTTARAAARAAEVGVRKTCGAQRRDLIVQFLGEATLVTVVGCVIALAAGHLLLPRFGALVGRLLSFARFWSANSMAEIAVFVLGVAVLAGSYPAFVLSAFRPATTLRSKAAQSTGSGRLRQVLVVFQFGVLISLALATIAMNSQIAFSVTEALRFDKSQVLLIDTPCTGSFQKEVARLPGVQAARCSGEMLAGQERAIMRRQPDGRQLTWRISYVDPGLFELYDIKASAGHLFADGDVKKIVLNEAAARQLGYASVEQAIGGQPLGADLGEVVGIVPDITMQSVREAVSPTVYSVGAGQANPFSTLNVKLLGAQIPETLSAIDDLWRRTGERPGPVSRRFYDQYAQTLYLDIVRQEQLFGILAAVAIFLSALGLFGLSAFTASQRTKEIGVRKALGASRTDILSLLLWRFSKPILWANVIAWPVAYIVMRHWLEGFAYHIELKLWMFVTASVLALVIAFLTVVGHAVVIARAEPVTALRYE